MSKPLDSGAGVPKFHSEGDSQRRRRRRIAAKRKKRQPFLPEGLGLERRMMPSTYSVTSTTDPSTITPGTLRWAIEQANSATSPSTIDFDLGSSPQTITLTQGQLELTNTADSITIDGPGISQVSISGHNASRVFQIDAGVTATISGLTITAGFSTGDGGGVLIAGGNVLMADVAVTNNEAMGSRGQNVSSGKIAGAGGDAGRRRRGHGGQSHAAKRPD